jgi:hypothetical protein
MLKILIFYKVIIAVVWSFDTCWAGIVGKGFDVFHKSKLQRAVKALKGDELGLTLLW